MKNFRDIARRGGSRASPGDSGGFVLPVVLLLLMVLSTVTVFFLISGSDQQRAGRALRESARSFYAADAGVNAVLAEWDAAGYDTLLATTGDSLDLGWRTLENGATYKAVFVRVDGDDTGFAIHSLRVTGQAASSFGGSATIFREVRNGGNITVDAAVKGGAGGADLDVDMDGFGGAGLSGLDTIPAGWTNCPALADKPGVTWADTTMVDVGGGGELVGSPAMVEDATITAASLLVFGGFTYDELVAMADITITDDDMRDGIGPLVEGQNCRTTGSDAEFNWGAPLDPASPCHDYFPIIHLTEDMRIRDMGGSGQGILLVDNELEIEDMDDGEVWKFFGIIIQKGPGSEGMEFEEPGVEIYGAIIAGGDVEIEDGARVRYSQCAVERALEANGLVGGAMTERVWRQAMN